MAAEAPGTQACLLGDWHVQLWACDPPAGVAVSRLRWRLTQVMCSPGPSEETTTVILERAPGVCKAVGEGWLALGGAAGGSPPMEATHLKGHS